MVEDLLKCLQLTINSLNSNLKVKLYGSRATNLCLIWSDLDIVLIKENEELEQFEILDNLNEKLNKEKWVKSVKYIKTAKIPIIKLITSNEFNNMQIDISIYNKEHFGLQCVKLVKSFLDKYESLEPLVFALKTMLKCSQLNDPYLGGISSYGIILMIVNFLQNQVHLGKKINKENLGCLLYDLLFFYGGRLDTNFINLNGENNILLNNNSPFELYIVDPLNSNNNVGKSTFQYMKIKMMFLIALQSLKEDCCCECHYTKENLIHYKQNILRKMFNAVTRLNPNQSF
jgi:non-canonical poly(A) RNA polymerase PAPD5/7